MAEIAGYKQNFAHEALEAKSKGTTYIAFANQKGIPYSSLISWVHALKEQLAANTAQEQE